MTSNGPASPSLAFFRASLRCSAVMRSLFAVESSVIAYLLTLLETGRALGAAHFKNSTNAMACFLSRRLMILWNLITTPDQFIRQPCHQVRHASVSFLGFREPLLGCQLQLEGLLLAQLGIGVQNTPTNMNHAKFSFQQTHQSSFSDIRSLMALQV